MAHCNDACSAGDQCLIPGSGRSPGEGNGDPLQYSCLENPHGQRGLTGYSPWGHKELETTECCLINRFRPILTPGLKSCGPSLLLELDILMLKRKGSEKEVQLDLRLRFTKYVNGSNKMILI